jgi:hypothetical protein
MHAVVNSYTRSGEHVPPAESFWGWFLGLVSGAGFWFGVAENGVTCS